MIAERRFIHYSGKSGMAAENLRQVLASLKSLRPMGPETELDVDETISRTARNGGEIELVFRRELRNGLKTIVLLDNGGYSMTPYVPLVRTVFARMAGTLRDLGTYYFHNCVYGTVYRDAPRTQPLEWDKLVNESRSTRLIIIGDANMAPSELMAAYGSLAIGCIERKPGPRVAGGTEGGLPGKRLAESHPEGVLGLRECHHPAGREHLSHGRPDPGGD